MGDFTVFVAPEVPRPSAGRKFGGFGRLVLVESNEIASLSRHHSSLDWRFVVKLTKLTGDTLLIV
jgi:hypothetical protein